MNSKHASAALIHDVKVTIAKVTVLYDAEGRVLGANVTANVWVAGIPGTTQEFTLSSVDSDMITYGRSLADILLNKIKIDHEAQ